MRNTSDLGNVRDITNSTMIAFGLEMPWFENMRTQADTRAYNTAILGEAYIYHLKIPENASARPKPSIVNVRTSFTVRLNNHSNIPHPQLITYLTQPRPAIVPMIWNDTAISRQCCGILATTEVKVDYKKLAEYMGPECTHRAVKFQVQNMKKAEKTSELTGDPTTKSATTPKSSGKRKANRDVSMDDMDLDETPPKIAKKPKGRANEGGDNDLVDAGSEMEG